MSVNLSNLSAAAVTTESDVEQKLILPLLTAAEWLAIPEKALRTKHYLPPATIDKGAGRRIGYFPDYSAWIDGLPILIVEAKSPLENVLQGFREAQLYAPEVNKAYPPGINPLRFVLAVNGKSLLFGEWDSKPSGVYDVSDLCLGNHLHTLLKETIGFHALKEAAAATRRRFRPAPLFRPANFIGGDATLNQRIGFNSFATDLAVLIRMFFVSDTAERIDDIIERAYVSSDEITKYDQILETFLRERVEQLAAPGARRIETTKHRETALTGELRQFAASLPTSGQIQLLIGPVGAGKSLFAKGTIAFCDQMT
jgi:Type I restriction enzyme R protein N terminus (HSDR_N)